MLKLKERFEGRKGEKGGRYFARSEAISRRLRYNSEVPRPQKEPAPSHPLPATLPKEERERLVRRVAAQAVAEAAAASKATGLAGRQ